MPLRVRVHLQPAQNLCYASYVCAGLSALAESGEIELDIRASTASQADGPFEDLVVRMDVETAGNRRRSVCIDLHDRSDRFAPESLDGCDLYFKRSYYAPDVHANAPGAELKVRSFGLTYPCADSASARRLLYRAGAQYFLRFCRAPLRTAARFKRECHELKKFVASPPPAEFEYGPDEPTDRAVLFQTRLWGPQETTDDTAELNEDRVSIVRSLRDAFGDAFWGGVVPTPFAIEHFPDALTRREARRADYIRMGRRSLIGVYTRGLHHSPAFKLPEYLAAAKCLVMPPLRNELPEPLVPGVNYLPFQTARECVDQCRLLSDDPTQAASMRRANADYYRRQVNPAARMRNCLQAAFAPPLLTEATL